MPLTPALPCVVCKGKPLRFRVQDLNTGRAVNVCSVKCLLSWCLGFSLGKVQKVVQLLLQSSR
jgi:hypothetical protein